VCLLKTTKGTPDERKQFTKTLLPLILFSISSNRAQNGNISLNFDLIQMRGTCRGTAPHGGARGTSDGQPGVAEPGRPRADVGDEGPERSTTGDGWRLVACGAVAEGAATAHSDHGGGRGAATTNDAVGESFGERESGQRRCIERGF
jgi:hypothetical protein